MGEFDPVIAKQFSWCTDLSPEQVMGDPTINARFLASYDVDPGYRAPDCDVEDLTVPGLHGADPVAVRLYRPTGTRPTAALVWAHGGGWISGSLDQREADGVARELATRAQALVVSVGYRLADGDHITYPQLHREVAAAFEWARQRCTGLGIDPGRLQLGGASAGASLALSATLEAIAEGTPLPGRLQLIYPLVHREVPAAETSHLDVVPDVLRLRQPLIDQFVSTYLGATTSPAYFELGDTDPARLPPSLVVVCEYDDLRPSGEQFARRLRDAGGEATLYLAKGTIHAHLSLSGTVAETERTLAVMASYLRG